MRPKFAGIRGCGTPKTELGNSSPRRDRSRGPSPLLPTTRDGTKESSLVVTGCCLGPEMRPIPFWRIPGVFEITAGVKSEQLDQTNVPKLLSPTIGGASVLYFSAVIAESPE